VIRFFVGVAMANLFRFSAATPPAAAAPVRRSFDFCISNENAGDPPSVGVALVVVAAPPRRLADVTSHSLAEYAGDPPGAGVSPVVAAAPKRRWADFSSDSSEDDGLPSPPPAGVPPVGAGGPPVAGVPPAAHPRVLKRPAGLAQRFRSRGQWARQAVLDGRRLSTAGGLKKEHLIKSPHTGVITSKKLALQMGVRYQGSKLQAWNASVATARIYCRYEGRFVPVGGRTVEGQQLLKWARHFYPINLEGWC